MFLSNHINLPLFILRDDQIFMISIIFRMSFFITPFLSPVENLAIGFLWFVTPPSYKMIWYPNTEPTLYIIFRSLSLSYSDTFLTCKFGLSCFLGMSQLSDAEHVSFPYLPLPPLPLLIFSGLNNTYSTHSYNIYPLINPF